MLRAADSRVGVTVLCANTTSACPVRRALKRLRSVTITYWTLFGSPSTAAAVALHRSTSIPSVFPVFVFRYPNPGVVLSVPHNSVPRLTTVLRWSSSAWAADMPRVSAPQPTASQAKRRPASKRIFMTFLLPGKMTSVRLFRASSARR